MHLRGKCKISWSNDDLERFLRVQAFCAPPWIYQVPGGHGRFNIDLANIDVFRNSLLFLQHYWILILSCSLNVNHCFVSLNQINVYKLFSHHKHLGRQTTRGKYLEWRTTSKNKDNANYLQSYWRYLVVEKLCDDTMEEIKAYGHQIKGLYMEDCYIKTLPDDFFFHLPILKWLDLR